MKSNTLVRGMTAILLILAMATGLSACGGGGGSSNSSGSSGSSGGISGSGS